MDKYITVDIPSRGHNNENIFWWIRDHKCGPTAVIAELERLHPGYDFHQFVTSPGMGGYREYALMKLKTQSV